jgi:hypothetical protein
MTATTPTPRVTRSNGVAAVHTATERAGAASIGKLATYWLSLIGVYVIQGGLWYYGAYEKIVGGHLNAPPPIAKAFAGSFVDTFPGVGVAWGAIAIAEALIVVGLAASLVRGEFLPKRDKPILMGSLAGSVVVLGALLFGQSMIGQHDSVASLFTYAAGTLVMMAAVAFLAPVSRFWKTETGTTDKA